MTRAELAETLEREAITGSAWDDTLREIAAELRKTCATCRYFRLDEEEITVCRESVSRPARTVPADGSGFCHRWEAKS